LPNIFFSISFSTTASALALKKVLGQIQLEPVVEEEMDPQSIIDSAKFKPYYIAHTKIQTLALLDEKYKGSNWYQWRRVYRFVRTHFKRILEVRT